MMKIFSLDAGPLGNTERKPACSMASYEVDLRTLVLSEVSCICAEPRWPDTAILSHSRTHMETAGTAPEFRDARQIVFACQQFSYSAWSDVNSLVNNSCSWKVVPWLSIVDLIHEPCKTSRWEAGTV
jgi:hypothetical protein